MTPIVDVASSGAVLLGEPVSCDGFYRDALVRVQTHVHSDHMGGFESSKGFQTILLNEATRRLLCQEFDADLPYRSNVIALPNGRRYAAGDSLVSLVTNPHMLGAVQVCVELRNGRRLGYSGDFQWPCDQVIQVDQLVVDSTYGSPNSVRRYDQGECEEKFAQLVKSQLRRGPVCVFAHRGTLQRALQILTGEIDAPIIVSRRALAETEIYKEFGYAIGTVTCAETPEGKIILRNGTYVRCYGAGDSRPTHMAGGASIKLTAYFSRPDDPITQYAERAFGVALSNHADFTGTLEYVRATGAQLVVTDNTRGGKAYELATEIRRRLDVPSYPSTNFETREWGM